MIITRSGYGYVEPNFLSAPRTGQVRGDAPVTVAAAETIAASADGALMNGMFVTREIVEGGNENNMGKIQLELADGFKNAWMVFNEEKLYDERKQMHKHFAMVADDITNGVMVPRIVKLLPGDTFTTNCFAQETELAVGDKVTVAAGMLVAGEDADLEVVVTKCYTMPDGEPGVKLEVR